MIWYLVGGILGVVYIAFCVWFVFEVITAPLVDEDDWVMSDPYHRLQGRRWQRWTSRRQRRSPESPGAIPPPTEGKHVVG